MSLVTASAEVVISAAPLHLGGLPERIMSMDQA
jgi:hypothetical protein